MDKDWLLQRVLEDVRKEATTIRSIDRSMHVWMEDQIPGPVGLLDDVVEAHQKTGEEEIYPTLRGTLPVFSEGFRYCFQNIIILETLP